MNHNPYTPPSANVAEATSAEAAPPKPIAVVVAQVLGVIVAGALSWVIVNFAIAFLDWQKIGITPTFLFAGLGLRIVLFAAVVVMLFQLPRRSQLGRWCGVLMILAILTFPFYLLATMQPDDIATPSSLAGFVFAYLITFLPVAYWLYAIAFSRKARAYFRGPARN